MTERRAEEPGRDVHPLPRDMPDQQAGGTPGPDPWDKKESPKARGADDDDVPDTDQAGTGRRGDAVDGDGPEEPSD